MKGFLLSAGALLLAANMAAGAETLVHSCVFSSATNESNAGSYTASFGVKEGEVSMFTAQNFNNNNNNWPDYVKCGPKNATGSAYVTTNNAWTEKVSKVVVNISAITNGKVNYISVSTSADGSNWTEAGKNSSISAAGDIEVAIATPTAGMYYQVDLNVTNTSTKTNGVATVKRLDYYAEEESGATHSEPYVTFTSDNDGAQTEVKAGDTLAIGVGETGRITFPDFDDAEGKWVFDDVYGAGNCFIFDSVGKDLYGYMAGSDTITFTDPWGKAFTFTVAVGQDAPAVGWMWSDGKDRYEFSTLERADVAAGSMASAAYNVTLAPGQEFEVLADSAPADFFFMLEDQTRVVDDLVSPIFTKADGAAEYNTIIVAKEGAALEAATSMSAVVRLMASDYTIIDFNVTVVAPLKETELLLDNTDIELFIGDEPFQLAYTLTEGSDVKLSLSTNPTGIVTVSNAPTQGVINITPVKAGKTVLTITAEDSETWKAFEPVEVAIEVIDKSLEGATIFDFLTTDAEGKIYGYLLNTSSNAPYLELPAVMTEGNVVLTLDRTGDTIEELRFWNDGLRFYKKEVKMTFSTLDGAPITYVGYNGDTANVVSKIKTTDGNALIGGIWEGEEQEPSFLCTSSGNKPLTSIVVKTGTTEDPVSVGAIETEQAAREMFDLNGRRVNGAPEKGIYIVRQGSKVSKVIVK